MYAFVMDVPMPGETYQRVSAEVERRVGAPLPQGCLLHLADRTPTGFRVLEVWESHEQADRFGDEIVRPAIERTIGLEAMGPEAPPSQELDVLRFQVSQQPVGV